MSQSIIHRPVRFQGTAEQAKANKATHNFQIFQYSEDDAECRCMDCDCRPSHAAADYPCGTNPPRETVVFGEAN